VAVAGPSVQTIFVRRFTSIPTSKKCREKLLNYGMATMRVNSWRRHYRSTRRDASRSISADWSSADGGGRNRPDDCGINAAIWLTA
jgi:hypothetical protein